MSGFNQRVEALFEATVAMQTDAERAQYLADACPDPALRREVESLVASFCDPDPVFCQTQKSPRSAQPVTAGFDRFLGQTLDQKYNLQRLLGQGGMGSVYLSTHLGIGRYVAVKLIAPEFMRNQEFVERFRREARAAGRLRHPNIVDVTDFGVASVGGESVAYLVMEYLDGCSLSDVLKEEKRLPLPSVVDIMEQVCSAVHEAHEQGTIHRDLKPANIWLEPNTLGGYRVKVLDFGVAKLAEATDRLTPPNPMPAVVGMHPGDVEPAELEPTPGASRSGESLTRAGALLGTPAYMSPEQCHGWALDARSDIYSLGIIAYQMMSGSAPFTGETAALLLAHQTREPQPLSQHCPNLPAALSGLVMAALKKEPSARPQTAKAFGQALRANAEGLAPLYQRAFALYSAYFPQVMKLSLLAHIPVVVVTLISLGLTWIQPGFTGRNALAVNIFLGVIKGAAAFVTGSLIAGMMSIVVVGLAVAPLKPLTLSSTDAILRRRLRPLLRTSLITTFRIMVGMVLLVVPGLIALMRYCLWAPVVLLEGLEGGTALRRSSELTARSWRTCVVAVAFQLLVPLVVEWMINRLITPSSTHHDSAQLKALLELTSLSGIFVTPLVSIVLALVYLKMRQLGGELLSQLLPHLETGSLSLWEQRVRTRLSERTPKTS